MIGACWRRQLHGRAGRRERLGARAAPALSTPRLLVPGAGARNTSWAGGARCRLNPAGQGGRARIPCSAHAPSQPGQVDV